MLPLFFFVAFGSNIAVDASHQDETMSAAIYRIPYQDGVNVDVIADCHNHGGTGGNRDRVDMRAVDDNGNILTPDTPAVLGDPRPLIVAAASGIIRVIEDSHGNDYGRGNGVTVNGEPVDDNLEHLCTDDADLPGSERCQWHNNYVWIEHPNNEWTKYSHLRTGTVRIDNGWSENMQILVGQVIGEEGTVGYSFGPHLHYEVAELGPFNGVTLPANIGDPGGFIQDTNDNHCPRTCRPGVANFEYADDNDPQTFITAGECDTTMQPTESPTQGPTDCHSNNIQKLNSWAGWVRTEIQVLRDFFQ